MNKFKYIVDMDGTLYKFDKGKAQNFISSQFYIDLRKNILNFFVAELMLKDFKAVEEFERINKKYKGEISIGIEKEYGFDRYKYYDLTWSNLEPKRYIKYDPKLRDSLGNMKGDIALLTAAPKIWVISVLNFLGINDVFGDLIFTGEPDIRKPNPAAFQTIVQRFNSPSSNFFSIGDQEESDIIPAKSIGMQTLKIGPGKTYADYQAPDIKQAIRLLKRMGFI
ncbi:MAG: HAD family hydrolase [Patescibacteria group bacterium]